MSKIDEWTLRLYVSSQTAVVYGLWRLSRPIRNQRGDFMVSQGMAVAAAVVLGAGVILAVKDVVLPWIQNLLGTCLQSAAGGTTGAGCP